MQLFLLGVKGPLQKKEGVSKDVKMVNINMYSLIHQSRGLVPPLQYVLHYKAQVISERLPLRT